MAMPTPIAPAAAEAATAATVDVTLALLDALTLTSCFAMTFALLVIVAFVSFRMTFVARAPAPLTALPTAPIAIDREAAAVVAEMVEASFASTVMLPVVASTLLVLLLNEAVTLLSISLYASATPMEMPAPTAPNPAATEAAPVLALMTEVSIA